MKLGLTLVWIIAVIATAAGCGRDEPAAPTPTPLAEFVEFHITAPFDSARYRPETLADAPRIESGDTEFRWEPVQGASKYTIILFDPEAPSAPDVPIPGDFYDQASLPGTSWSTNLVYRPGMDGDGRQLTVEISAYDATGYALGFTGRFVFFVVPT